MALCVCYAGTYNDVVLTFKCVRGLAPKYLSSRFNTRASVHGRNTRNNNKLDIPAFHTAAGQRSFLYRAVKCWNTLPDEITECKACTVLNLRLRVVFIQLLHEFIISYYSFISLYVLLYID